MTEKDYYSFSDIWELYYQIKDEIGAEEMLENMFRWLGMEDGLKRLKSIATDFDLWNYEEE